MPWMIPSIGLDALQEAVLTECAAVTAERPKWIEGFAGSGKTILLVYAAQAYVDLHPDGKICIVVYTHSLIDLIKSGIAPRYREAIPVMTYLHFVNVDRHNYDLAIVDEVQDIPSNILAIIRRRSNKLLVGGDDAQSIYPYGSRAERIEEILHPDRTRLPLTYRLTRSILRIAKNLLPDNNIVDKVKERINDVQVILAHAVSIEIELTWVWSQAKGEAGAGSPSVVVLPDHVAIQNFIRLVARYENYPVPTFPPDRWNNHDYSLANNIFKTRSGNCLQYLGNGFGSLNDSEARPVVYVMTYHSIKGLDFMNVFLPLLTSDAVFWDDPDIDRRLFFVGVTRSRSGLFLSYHGSEPHPYVQQMPQKELRKFEIAQNDDLNDDDFVL